MNNQLAIITVNYNNYSVTQEFLESVNLLKQNNFKVFITDLSTKKENILSFPWLEIINATNKGYAHGVNLGLKQALAQGFKAFAVVNNDVRLDLNFVNHVFTSIQKFPNSIIGGKIYYEKGFEYHKNRYSDIDLGKVIWYAGGNVDWKNAYTLHRGVDQIDKGQYDDFMETEFVTGCLMAFDKGVIDKIGFWDENYFLYYEDADYCERTKKHGIKLYYDPSIIIWHKNAQSTDGSGSKLQQKYQKQNLLRFGFKYAPWQTKIHLLKNCLSFWFKATNIFSKNNY
jgi:GT2 family glycosyltransferase